MIRLVVKEFREKLVWVGVLAGFLWIGSAGGLGQVYFSRSIAFDILGQLAWTWTIVAIAMACLPMGLGGFSSELTANRSHFLFSRPVSWKKALLAKVIAGLVGIAVVVLIATIIYWLLLPSQYKPFADWPEMLTGASQLGLAAAGFFVLGLIVSPVLPGVFGSALTLLLICVALGLSVAAFDYYGVKTMFWPIAGWAAGVLLALIVVTRFGLTLPLRERFIRFGLCALAVLAVLSPIGFATDWPESPMEWWSKESQAYYCPIDNRVRPQPRILRTYSECSVSPDASTVAIRYDRNDNWILLLNLRTGKSAKIDTSAIDGPAQGNFPRLVAHARWIAPGTLLFVWADGLQTHRLTPDGRLTTRSMSLQLNSDEEAVQPQLLRNRRYLLFRLYPRRETSSWAAAGRAFLLVDVAGWRETRLMAARKDSLPARGRITHWKLLIPKGVGWITPEDMEDAEFAAFGPPTLVSESGWSTMRYIGRY